MAKQLRFEGDPVFEPTPFESMLKQLYVDPIREQLNRSWPLNFLLYGDSKPQPRNIQQHLFERSPTCPSYFELGDETLYCYKDDGHEGLHYDSIVGIEWGPRLVRS